MSALKPLTQLYINGQKVVQLNVHNEKLTVQKYLLNDVRFVLYDFHFNTFWKYAIIVV